MSIYQDKVRKKKETDKLHGELKSEGTASLAKRLYAAGLTYSQVKDIYKESESYEIFVDSFKSAGVKYRPWHEKLYIHFKKVCKK